MNTVAFLLDGGAVFPDDLRSPSCIYLPLIAIVASWMLVRANRTILALCLATISALGVFYRPWSLIERLDVYPFEQWLMIGFAIVFPYVCIARFHVVSSCQVPNKSPEPTTTAVTPRADEGKSK